MKKGNDIIYVPLHSYIEDLTTCKKIGEPSMQVPWAGRGNSIGLNS